jgi:hypothetical protein
MWKPIIGDQKQKSTTLVLEALAKGEALSSQERRSNGRTARSMAKLELKRADLDRRTAELQRLAEIAHREERGWF